MQSLYSFSYGRYNYGKNKELRMNPEIASETNPLQKILDEYPRRKPSNTHNMDQEEVLRVLELAEIASIPLVVAGGWAVDALLGWQTRPHGDLDLAINRSYLLRFLGILSRIGYGLIDSVNANDKSFILDNGVGHQIEIHIYNRDEKGRIVSGTFYPSDSLTGQGKIGHLKVSCIAPEWLIDSYSEKEINEKTLQDIKYLANLFRLPLPIEFKEYDDSIYLKSNRHDRILPSDFELVEPITGNDYAKLVFCLSDVDPQIAEDVRQNEAARFEKVFVESAPSPIEAASHDLRTGLLVKRKNEIIGAIELGPLRSLVTEESKEGKIWQIKQLKMGEYSEYARIFKYIIENASKWAKQNGANQLRVAPLDDVSTNRAPMLKEYDMAHIGYATKYVQLGFEPLKGETIQRLILVKKLDE